MTLDDLPNAHTIQVVIASIKAGSIAAATGIDETIDSPRTELDYHANMAVLGKNAFVFETTGWSCNVQPFTSELGIATNVPTVDGVIAYDCPYSSCTYILIV